MTDHLRALERMASPYAEWAVDEIKRLRERIRTLESERERCDRVEVHDNRRGTR